MSVEPAEPRERAAAPPDPGRRHRRRRFPPALWQFALPALAAMVLVAFGGVYALRQAGETEAIDDAKRLTRILGDDVVGPRLTPEVLDGVQPDLREFDGFVHQRVLDNEVRRVKVWSRDGRILYSDEPRLIGSNYTLGADELEVLDDGGIDAELSDLDEPENRYEDRDDELLEVYLPIESTDGRKALFELYLPYSTVSADARELWQTFAPVLLVALVLLWLVQLPLAWSYIRRLREARQERERLLLQAISASDVERRRIAGDLHDGVVQDLAGVAFTLSGEAQAAQARGDAALNGSLTAAADATRQGIRRLRTLLVELHPPSLQSSGIAAALEDLAQPLSAHGVEAHVVVDEDLDLPAPVERLLFRATQEALRNVISHAGAGRVDVTLAQPGGHVVLTIHDDGRGIDEARLADRRAEGHLGLSLLASSAEDLGGTLTIDSAPGRGATIRLEVPLT